MADIEVDPSQVHSIEVDPSQVQAVGEKSGFFGRLGENVSGLLNLGVGVATHPLDTAKAMLTPDPVVAKESADAFNRGDYGRAAGSLIEDIPLIGPQIRRSEQDVRKGDYGALAADTATALALGKLPGLARKIPGVNRALEVAGEAAHDPLGLQHAEPAARAATLERMGVPAEAPAPTPAASPGRAAPIARMLIDKLAKKHPFIKGGMMAIDLAKAVGEIMDEPKAPEPPSAAPEASKPTAAAFDLEKWKQAKLAQRAPTPPGQPTPEMAQQASVPFTPEEQALADHVMAGVEPQPEAIKPNVNPAEGERSGANIISGLSRGEPGISITSDAPGSRLRRIVYRDANGTPQGYLQFHLNDEQTAVAPKDHGLFPEVFVAPGARRTGIATQLYDAAKKNGFDLSEVSGTETTPAGAAFLNKRAGIATPQPPAAPPVGSDYVMPEPAPPQPAGRPNVGDPRLATPPVLPPPTFPQPEAPPATEPPAVNPGSTVNPPAPASTPAVRPADPSGALGAFGVDEPLVLNRARVNALAKDNGISEWDQLKMLRDQGIKIQDDPFMTGETQRNRRGKVTSPEPMKPEAKPASEIELHRGGSEQGNYYSTSRDFAREFTHSGRDSEVRSLKVPTSDILDLGNKTPGASDVAAVDAAKEAAKSAGKRAFYVDEGQGQPRSVFMLDKEAAPKPPTAAETEAAIRKQKMTELGELLNRKSEAPAADVTPERTLYHGTAAPDFKAFKGMTYLTDKPVEASLYANGLPGAGVRGGSPRVLHVKVGAGKTLNIAEAVENEIMDGGDIDKVIADKAKEAKAGGYRFLQFDHPGSKGGDIPVTVSLYPEDLSIQKSAKPSRSTKVVGGELGKLSKAEIDKLPAKQAVEYLRQTKR